MSLVLRNPEQSLQLWKELVEKGAPAREQTAEPTPQRKRLDTTESFTMIDLAMESLHDQEYALSVIEGMVDMLTAQVNRGIELTNELEASIPLLSSHAYKLEDLRNKMGNRIKSIGNQILVLSYELGERERKRARGE